MSTPPPASSQILHELTYALETLEAASKSLESQQALLRTRGIVLPPQVMTTLLGSKQDVERLQSLIVEEQTELSQLRALASMAERVSMSLEVDAVLRDTMDSVIALSRAERGYILLQNPTTGEWEFRISRDDTVNPLRGGGAPQISRTILNEVVTTRQPLLADNAYKDERLASGASIASMTLRSVLCVPMLNRDQLIGVVYVDNRLQASIFTEREKNMLMAFANIAAVAIANASLFSDIQATLEEISQVKELMDNVFESIGSGVVATDAALNITTFNHAAQRMFQLPPSEVIGHNLALLLQRLDPSLHEALADVLKLQKLRILESDLQQAEGQRAFVRISLSPLRDGEGTPQGVALVLDDITSELARDEQLNIIKTYLPPAMVDNITTISGLALGGERRQVSCMFAEVRPFSSLKGLAPDEMLAALNLYIGVATDAIFDAQGVIDKYMGTEVMALFNTQLNTQENHAWLAVEAALMMRDSFLKLYASLGISPEPHYYRIGIHSGIATLGNVGSWNRRDFTALGDTINLAKRLEENALGGQIIISEATLHYIQASLPAASPFPYRVVELTPIQVKGRQQQTRIYEVFRL